jgi:hypothetical protein
MRWVWCIILITAAAAGSLSAFGKEKAKADAFFDAATLHRFDLTVSHEGWDAMSPGWSGRRHGWFEGWAVQPATRPATTTTTTTAAATKPIVLDVHGHPMGRSFRYVRAELEFDGKPHGGVAVRFKGNSSYVASEASYKRPMKVDFNRVEDGRDFLGLNCLNFNNNALDPSLLREHLAYAMFREAGVPAPRTALASVTLTVDPLVKQKRLGAYVIVEDVDKRFLKSRFGSGEGLLLKPEGETPFRYMGDDLEPYLSEYTAKTKASPEVGKRLVELAKLVDGSDDATFEAKLESFMDVDEFLRFLAVNVLLSNYDSILALGHNYYIYIDPLSLKAHFIPWDLNMSFGGYVRIPAKQSARCSIDRPCVGRNRLIDRVLKIERFRERYHATLGELNDSVFQPERLVARVEKLDEMIREAKGWPKEPSNPSVARGALAEPPALKQFIRDRHSSVAAQLSGDVTGVYVPRFVHGPITGFLGRGAPREMEQ